MNAPKIEGTGTVVLAIVIGVIAFFAMQRVDTYLKIKAMDDCAKISRYETTDGTAKVSYPVRDNFETCLKDKGYMK